MGRSRGGQRFPISVHEYFYRHSHRQRHASVKRDSNFLGDRFASSRTTFVSSTLNGGNFQSSIGGNVGPEYFIYGTTNLSGNWQLLLDTNPVTTPFLFTDPDSTNFSQRYYRVLLGP